MPQSSKKVSGAQPLVFADFTEVNSNNPAPYPLTPPIVCRNAQEIFTALQHNPNRADPDSTNAARNLEPTPNPLRPETQQPGKPLPPAQTMTKRAPHDQWEIETGFYRKRARRPVSERKKFDRNCGRIGRGGGTEHGNKNGGGGADGEARLLRMPGRSEASPQRAATAARYRPLPNGPPISPFDFWRPHRRLPHPAGRRPFPP